MFVIRFIILFFGLVHFPLCAGQIPQLYNTYMVQNSHKYVEYVYLAHRIYDEGYSTVGKSGSISEQRWQLVSYEHKLNGFEAGVYRNLNTGKYVLSVGGTTANPKGIGSGVVVGDLLDIGTDIRLISNFIPTGQASSALTYYDQVAKQYNISAITGHSLGGGLAAYIGLYANVKTITFNPSPIPFTTDSLEKFLENHAVWYPPYKKNKEFRYRFDNADKIVNIMSSNDPVSNISFLLENTDSKYYDAIKFNTWNFFKGSLFFALPKEVHLDYANQGKNIWLPIETGHPVSAMLEKMKDAKEYGDELNFKAKYIHLEKKLKALKRQKYIVIPNIYKENGHINVNYPNERANKYFTIDAMRTLYNRKAKILEKTTYTKNSSFIEALGLKSQISINIVNDVKSGISYRNYMHIAQKMYKKLFGNSFFVKRYIERKKSSTSYKIYDDTFRKYAKDDVKNLYRDIFLLHFVGGIPKKYLQNDSQNITNAFMITFFYKLNKNVIKYRNLKLKGTK